MEHGKEMTSEVSVQVWRVAFDAKAQPVNLTRMTAYVSMLYLAILMSGNCRPSDVGLLMMLGSTAPHLVGG